MRIGKKIRKLLGHYGADTPGTKANLAKFLCSGKLANTGRMIILPVDQGFEHGPGRSFAANPSSYDPTYHVQLALDAGLSGYAAPLGMLEVVSDHYAGTIPTLLKLNSANALTHPTEGPDQAITATPQDALRLGCSAVGLTIYPGSPKCLDMFEEVREICREAKSLGLPTVIWSYPRGDISIPGETALDVVAYGAHMACLLGAHIVKVKLPTAVLESEPAKKVYLETQTPRDSLQQRVQHVVQSCFDGKRLVIFSGGETKDVDGILEDARAIHQGGGHGSIIGRNCFKRPRAEALALLQEMVNIYKERCLP